MFGRLVFGPGTQLVTSDLREVSKVSPRVLLVDDEVLLLRTLSNALREEGFSERELFEITAFVAFRLAFSTVNDALGIPPDAQLVERAPEPLRNAVAFGRAPAGSSV